MEPATGVDDAAWRQWECCDECPRFGFRIIGTAKVFEVDVDEQRMQRDASGGVPRVVASPHRDTTVDVAISMLRRECIDGREVGR
jgi:hypothetical protein